MDVVKAINDIVNSVFRLVTFSFLKASFVSLGNVPLVPTTIGRISSDNAPSCSWRVGNSGSYFSAWLAGPVQVDSRPRGGLLHRPRRPFPGSVSPGQV
jgi:hypothetical protein